LSARRLSTLPPALGRRLVRDVLTETAPGETPSARHLDAVRALARADSSGEHLDLPGVTVRRVGDRLTFSQAPAGEAPVSRRARRRPSALVSRPLALPGFVILPEAGVTITASVGTDDAERQGPRPAVARLQAESVTPPLEVRFWRAGDRFRPLGAPGRRKVQDLFVDRKVPRDERRRVPIVVDATGRILWVAGVAVAEECRVTAPEAGVVTLEMRKP
jgi:tRNA(Ile)-lysidine synthase